MKNLSIKMKLQLAAFVSIIIVSVLIAASSIYSVKKLSKDTIQHFAEDAYAKKEKELKNYVSLAVKTVETYFDRTSPKKVKEEVKEELRKQTGFLMSIIEGEYKKYSGKVPAAELKERIRQIVKSTRYGKTGYFWINDIDAVIVMHPIKPQLDGKNLYTYKDKGGKQIFKEFAAVAKKNGEGFVDYVWPKPGFEKPQAKVSFVKLFKEYNWVIGTGEYVDNVTEKMKKEALNAVSEMRYGQTGYYWINDSEPKMIMHPIKPQLNGKNLSKVKDPAGKFLFNEMVDVTKTSQGGFVKYMWSKPGKEEPQPKLSYVQKFGAWDWIIGTGEYVDNIEEEIIAMKNATEEEISNIITTILILTLIVIAATYIISSILFNKAIISPLSDLNEAINELVNSKDNKRAKIEKHSNDEVGNVVDSFNSYINKLDNIAKQDELVISEVEDVIQKVNNGFYVYKVHSNSENPLVNKLKNSINSMIDHTDTRLKEINDTLLEYGSSNFTQRSNQDENNFANGIVGSIINSTYLLGSAVSELIAMITSSGKKLNEDTNILSNEVDKLAKSANEQAASLEETAAAVDEITSIVRANVEKIARMSILANDLNKSASSGQELANKTTQAMEDIDNQVNSINDAITVIDQIAFQTNILSLNAAVEAATAGEAGKGFAVVAQEVRNLASRSAEAAKEIKGIVESATAKANEGKAIANDMSSGYNELNTKVTETIDLISEVTDGSKEQETGIVQINDTITDLDRATQINAASASQINSLSNEVLGLSQTLLSIADRTEYDKSKEGQICDIDLVYKISKLKNDHIVFKNKNFAEVGKQNVSAWSVTKHTDCDLGKWLLEQERNGESFTKTSNWSELKTHHMKVHDNVQEYINKNTQSVSNSELINVSKNIEISTVNVFRCLDNIKTEHCKSLPSNISVPKVEVSTQTTLPSNPREEVKIQTKTAKVETPKVSPKVDVITPNNSDDDEWESF